MLKRGFESATTSGDIFSSVSIDKAYPQTLLNFYCRESTTEDVDFAFEICP